MANENQNGKQMVITRVFNTPRQLVFKALTEPERIAKWWGPKGSNIHVSKMDVRPGGVFLYSMSGPPHNTTMWGKFIYHEIVSPGKLVFVNCFADEQGNTIPCPFFDVWPLEVLNTLILTEQEGKTTLTITGGPNNASEEERKAFEAMLGGMQQGFAGTFDQLDEYLATVKTS